MKLKKNEGERGKEGKGRNKKIRKNEGKSLA